MEKIYSVQEAAELLGTCDETVRRMLKSGELKGIKFKDNGNWKIKESELVKKYNSEVSGQ